MGRKGTPGLYSRSGMWHIDKVVRGYGRICESCGTGNLEEAERYLSKRLEEIRNAVLYGTRPARTFKQAATEYLNQYMDKDSIARDAQDLKLVVPFIGDLPLKQIHMGTLERFIAARRREGRNEGTINRTLAVVRRILNLAARLWRDECGLTWLETAPMIVLLPNKDRRQPYPLSWEEQQLLFSNLPEHLHEMALYKVNTGCREQEVCKLRWSWEREVPELGVSVFVIPERLAKNRQERVVVLNSVARSVVDKQRGRHPEYVFTYKGKPVTRIYNSAWKRARRVAAGRYKQEAGGKAPDGFTNIRVHDLRHTFGRRLRAAGVSYEDRQDLLGHKSGRMTTHYSAPEVASLVEAVEKIAATGSRKSPALTLVRLRERGQVAEKDGGDGRARTADLSIMSAAL